MRIQSTLVLLTLLSSLCLAQDKNKIGPRIEANAKGWNFGIVNQGKIDQKVIVLKNTGDEVLLIQDIKVTCGCVHAVMANKTIEPGKSQDLVLKLSTYRAYGPVRKHCYIYSNSGAAKRPLVLTIDGEVKADWWPDTKQIQLGRVDAGLEHVHTFRIKSRIRRDIDIESITCRNPNIEISYKREEKKNDLLPSYLVTVTLKPTAPPGPFAAAIPIRVKHRQTPLQNVMVYGRLEGETKVAPLKVFIGRIFYDQKAHKVVKLTLQEGYTIVSAKGSLDSIETQIRPMPDGTSWEIDLYVTGLESQKNVDATLTIETNHPLQPRIKIPVNWVSRPQQK